MAFEMAFSSPSSELAMVLSPRPDETGLADMVRR
jgi:hypothetical protein